MNKLEELKALIKEKDDAKQVYKNYPDNYQNYMRNQVAHCNLIDEVLELLPDLLAVAEAEKFANDRWEAKDWDAESRGVHIKKLEEVDDNYFVLAKLLEPLTKDTDK